jgi:hypothetical protein
MPTIDARIVLILILVELPILLALIWALRKLRAQAPDDQVLFVQRGDKEVRYLPGERYWRRPGDQIVRSLSTGKQTFGVVVPHIVVGSGLAVDVHLRFVASLAIDRMEPQEHLFDDAQRHEAVAGLIKPHLQRLVEKILRSSSAPTPSRIGMGAFLSPLFGETLKDILKRLHFHAKQDLAHQGILLTDQPLEVESLMLSSGVVDAYRALERRRFADVDRFEFVKRIEAITPGVSEQALVQLYFAVDGPNGPLHSMLSSGVIPADMLVADRNAVVSLFDAPDSLPVSLSSLAPKQDYPLTVEEMRLLKELGA